MQIAAAARAAVEVVLERRVAARDCDDAIDRGGRERRAPEVGVDDDAGRVDHALQRGAERAVEPHRGRRFDLPRGGALVRDRRAAAGDGAAQRGRGFAQCVQRRVGAEARFERPHGCPLAQRVDRRNHPEVRHGFELRRIARLQNCPRRLAVRPLGNLQYYGITSMASDPPRYRPLERFWPYAELPEQPTNEELAALDPDLREALFGQEARPFSITLVFPRLDIPDFPRALELARASAEFRETGAGPALRYRARFWSSDALKLRDLFQIVGGSDATDVLIDDRPVPYARELWLPLVWFLIPR